MSKRSVILIALVVLLLGAAALAWQYRAPLMAALPFAGADRGDGGRQRPPPLVEVAQAEQARIQTRIPATGTLKPPEEVTLTAETAGRVADVRFTEGDRVERGEVLIELERERAAATVEQARARLAQRARDTQRKQELRSEDFVSADELERSAAATEEAEAALEIAREDLDDRSLSAPFAGVTGRRMVSPGALVEPGTPVTRLVQTGSLDLLLDVPGRELGRVRRGLPVEAHTPAYPDRSFRGEVTFVGTEVDEATRTLPLEATIDNAEGLLKPGMYLQAEVLVGERQAVRVPEAAILTQGPTQLVYRVDETGQVERRTVTTGERRAGWVEIESGVEPGQRVVTAGLGRLRDGMRVRTGEGQGHPGASGSGGRPDKEQSAAAEPPEAGE